MFSYVTGDQTEEDISTHSKSLKSLERQIFMETLRYEQERLQLVSMHKIDLLNFCYS